MIFELRTLREMLTQQTCCRVYLRGAMIARTAVLFAKIMYSLFTLQICQLRKQILKLAHETHQGIVKSKQFLRAHFFWPSMDQAVEATIKGCSACVLNQPLNKYTPLQPTPLPRGPWVKGAVDLVGPIDGKYILTYVDYYSSYPELCVLKEITSREVIKALTDIFSRFGYPEEIVSDNGKQFTSAEFEAFLTSCGIKHIRVSPYYARSNGKLERFHRYLKKNFRAVIAEGKSWRKELLKILMLYRASPHPVSGKSPAMLLFNRELQTTLSASSTLLPAPL